MKEPERLVGFVNYDDSEIAFEFDAEEFVLRLYPSQDKWKEYAHPRYGFNLIFYKNKGDEWLPENRLVGTCSAGKRIVFSVQDNPGIYHGFLSFEVNWYFCCYEGMNENSIKGFSITGPTVEAFYSPYVALEQTHEYDENSNRSKMVVSSVPTDEVSCGSYSVNETTIASLSVLAYCGSGLGSFERPLFANSKFVVDFDEPTDLDTTVAAFEHILRFFIYSAYRANVGIRLADLYLLNKQGKRDYLGILVLPKADSIEKDQSVLRRCLSYGDLGEKTASIVSDLRDHHMTLQYICENHKERSLYPVSRVIMILASFERVYGTIYGKDTDRSQLYIDTKDEVIKIILTYEDGCSGKKKGYAKSLRKYVENRDSSFAFNVSYALKDCVEIMAPFIKKRYKKCDEEIIGGISERLGEIRNGVAHCRLDFDLEPIHMKDLLIMEELLYAMELKHIGLPIEKSGNAVSSLFNEQLTFAIDNISANSKE